jgi:hypothetical protein
MPVSEASPSRIGVRGRELNHRLTDLSVVELRLRPLENIDGPVTIFLLALSPQIFG